jgi:amino acid transporter
MTGFLVVIKLAVVAIFVLTGMFFIKPSNWTPFMPNGFGGMFTSAFTIFFALKGVQSRLVACNLLTDTSLHSGNTDCK